MATILRFLQIFALGTWVGGVVFVFLIAPGVFATLPTRHMAGSVVGMALTKLHLLGYVASALFLAAAIWLWRSNVPVSRAAVAAVVLMLVLTAVSQHVVTAKVVALRERMSADFGSVDNTPSSSPLRAEFGKLHGVSSSLELLTLFAGVVGLFLSVKKNL